MCVLLVWLFVLVLVLVLFQVAAEAMPEAGDPPSLMVNPPDVFNGSGGCPALYRPSRQKEGASFGLHAPFWNSRV